jgi:hypothetical protein
MEWRDENGIDFIFALPGNAALDRLVDETADDIRIRRALDIVHLRSGLPQAARTEHFPIPCSIFWRSIKSNRLTGQPAEAISPRIAFWCLGQLRSPELVDTNDRVSDFAMWGTRSGRGPPAAPSSAVAGGPRVRIQFPLAASRLRT